MSDPIDPTDDKDEREKKDAARRKRREAAYHRKAHRDALIHMGLLPGKPKRPW